MPKSTRRLTILTTDEIQGLFGLPYLSPDERDIFFSLDPTEAELIDSARSCYVKRLCCKKSKLQNAAEQTGEVMSEVGDFIEPTAADIVGGYALSKVLKGLGQASLWAVFGRSSRCTFDSEQSR